MEKNLFISFRVDVRNEQWGSGYNAQCEITIPRTALDELDPGTIFQACLKSALLEYDNAEDKEKA